MTEALSSPPARRRIATWVVLVAPAATWFAYEVGLASALRLSCSVVGSGLGVAWGCASLMVCALAAWMSWRPWEPVDDASPARPWLSRVALIASALFALAIAFQTIATLIVPSCAR